MGAINRLTRTRAKELNPSQRSNRHAEAKRLRRNSGVDRKLTCGGGNRRRILGEYRGAVEIDALRSRRKAPRQMLRPQLPVPNSFRRSYEGSHGLAKTMRRFADAEREAAALAGGLADSAQ